MTLRPRMGRCRARRRRPRSPPRCGRASRRRLTEAAASRVACPMARSRGSAYCGCVGGHRPVQRRGAGRGDVHVRQRLVRRGRRVGRERQQRAGVLVLGPREARSARSSPSIAAQFSQIAGSACTGCMDAVTPSRAIRSAVPGAAYSRCSMRWRRGRSPLRAMACSIASSAISLASSPIACMRDLQPRGIRRGDDRLQLLERPDRARRSMPFAVRMPHRGGARVDHAVEDELDADHPEPGRRRRGRRARRRAATWARFAASSPVLLTIQCAATRIGSLPPRRSCARSNAASPISSNAMSTTPVTPSAR